MGKVCGLRYYDINGNVVNLSSDKCNHGWESFGTIKVPKGSTLKIGVQYDCDWYLGCDVGLNFWYYDDKVWRKYNFRTGYGKSWLETVIMTPSKSQYVSCVVYQKDTFGNWIEQDKMFFMIDVIEQEFKPVIKEFTTDKKEYYYGDIIKVGVLVTNEGNVGGNARLYISVDGSEYKYVGSAFIGAGSSKVLEVDLRGLSVGSHEICVEVRK